MEEQKHAGAAEKKKKKEEEEVRNIKLIDRKAEELYSLPASVTNEKMTSVSRPMKSMDGETSGGPIAQRGSHQPMKEEDSAPSDASRYNFRRKWDRSSGSEEKNEQKKVLRKRLRIVNDEKCEIKRKLVNQFRGDKESKDVKESRDYKSEIDNKLDI